jgi:integrase
MAWQKGSLYEAHGAWHVRYYTADHKQKSKKLCDGDATKKQRGQAFTEFMAKVNDVREQPSLGDLTIVKFWDDTYRPFMLENHKPSTQLGYLQTWKKHLKPHFADTLLKNYRTSTMSVFLTSLARTLRPHSLKHIKSLGQNVFAHAVATGQCEFNPIRDAKVLGTKLPNGVTGSYTLEEIENIITALVDHVDCQLIMALSFFLGLRRGEIQGLQWGDIDANFVHVRRSITRGVGGLFTTAPKTLKSVRSLPIIEPVRTLLKLQKRDGLFLFAGELGYLSSSIIVPTLEKAGLQWKGFHAGRRGLGTVLKKLTGNSIAGKNVLGHEDEKTTHDHYEHALPEEALKGLKLLEAAVTTK